MIDPTTQFIIGLFLLVASGVIVGEIFTHLGQAALVGQLLVGVLLGPSLLGPALGLSSVTPEFVGLQTLATFFILLMAGLSFSPQQLRATGVPSILLGVAIFFVPFLTGAGLVHLPLSRLQYDRRPVHRDRDFDHRAPGPRDHASRV